MQYKVPQNIDKEDEIVGPLTLVQFSYLAIAGAIDFLVFKSLPSLALGLLIMVPVTVVALAMAFLKVQDQPLLHFIAASLQYYRSPKTRVWDKVSDRPIIQAEQAAEMPVAQPLRKTFDQAKVAEISQVLDTHGHSGHEHQTSAQPFENVSPDSLTPK